MNIRGVVPCNEAPDAARHYLMNTLLAAGPWQSYGEEPARASVNFAYTLAGRRLTVSIDEAAIQLPEGETSPILLFSGNFSYPVEGDFAQLLSVMDNWSADLAVYQDLINQHFLTRASATLPISEPELVPVGA